MKPIMRTVKTPSPVTKNALSRVRSSLHLRSSKRAESADTIMYRLYVREFGEAAAKYYAAEHALTTGLKQSRPSQRLKGAAPS
jgi:hypothetical protein